MFPQRLREGVLNDLARQQKKLQNVLHLEQQGDITKLLRQQQQLQDEEDRKIKLNSDR